MPSGYAGHSRETAGDKLEEGGDDVKSSWPLRPGLHTYYNGRYRGLQDREVEQILKTGLSSDWSLQLDSMKVESLVIADQQVAVNTFPGLVHTVRPRKLGVPEVVCLTARRAAPKVKPVTGAKS